VIHCQNLDPTKFIVDVLLLDNEHKDKFKDVAKDSFVVMGSKDKNGMCTQPEDVDKVIVITIETSLAWKPAIATN